MREEGREGGGREGGREKEREQEREQESKRARDTDRELAYCEHRLYRDTPIPLGREAPKRGAGRMSRGERETGVRGGAIRESTSTAETHQFLMRPVIVGC